MTGTFPTGIHGAPFIARAIPPREVDGDDFVGNVELLAEPDDAKTAGGGDVMDSEHGIGPYGQGNGSTRHGYRSARQVVHETAQESLALVDLVERDEFVRLVGLVDGSPDRK